MRAGGAKTVSSGTAAAERDNESDRHLLFDVAERLRTFEDVDDLFAFVSCEVGEYLRASSSLFAEVDLEHDEVKVHRDYHPGAASSVGTYPLSMFSPVTLTAARAGHTTVNHDARTDPRTAPYFASAYRAVGTLAYVAVPLMRDGQLTSLLLVSSSIARIWADREVALLQEIAERTWLWVEHVRMVRALRASESQFRQIVETAHEGIWQIDAHSATSFTNARMAQILGYGAAEMLGRALDDFLDDEGRAIAAANIERRRQGISESHEFKFLRKDGSPVWTRLETNPLFDEHGTYLGALAMVADITEQRQSEQELRDSEERFRLLVGATADQALCLLDAEGRVTSWNSGAERLLGFSAPAVLGQSHAVFFPREDRDKSLPDEIRHAAVAAGRHEEEGWRVRQGGSRFWANVVLTALRDAQGGLRGFAQVMRDFSERRRAEEERARLTEDLKTLASNLERRVEERTEALVAALRDKEILLKEIHHRVKNNLQVVSSLLSLQAQRLPAEIQVMFAESQARVQSIALVHEKIYQSGDLASVDFGAYLRSLLAHILAAQSIVEKGIVVAVDVDVEAVGIDVAVPCGLIANELITNSFKHAFPAGRSGKVAVGLHRIADGRFELTVADDGIGLPAHFDPRHTDSLGLDLVFTFAEQLGAEVAVGVDRAAGTSFAFRFCQE